MSEFNLPSPEQQVFSPFWTYDPNVTLYDGPVFGLMYPYEYTDWRDEQMAWKDACYIHAGLNPTFTSRVKGTDALQFFKDFCVNSFEKFPVGKSKQATMCDDDGYVMGLGLLTRTAEDEFYTYWLEPYLSYAFSLKEYNATIEQLTGKVFLFQLAGPKSLQIIEKASGEDFHDVKFLHHKTGHICGKDIRVIRIGMAGSLAYEVHGNVEDAHLIYDALVEAGQEFGIKKLGRHAYFMNHTLGGFPQAILHFSLRMDDPKFIDYMINNNMPIVDTKFIKGSLGGSDPSISYRTVVENGWSKMIKFDHDFRGRKALEKEVANPKRTMVTLEWNYEDIMDIHRSQYLSGEPYAPIDEPSHYQKFATLWQDKVTNKEGKMIGISSGREFSCYYKKMLSLCTIDIEYAEIGTKVIVIYGEPGTRQKEIHATVSRFPYFIDGRNQDVDTDTILRLGEK